MSLRFTSTREPLNNLLRAPISAARARSLLAWLPSLLFLAFFAAAPAAADSFEKALMPGEVIHGHAKYELECNKCHQRFDKAAQPKLCNDCHKDVAADIAAKTGMHGRLDDKACRNCHSEHKGRNA